VSLYHRLAGAWWAVLGAGDAFEDLSGAGTVARSLWQGFIATGGFADVPPDVLLELPECPLMGAFGLLPVLLFYHEDPLYLGDRLRQFGAGDRLCLEFGRIVSACLRERLDIAGLPQWLAVHSELSPEGKTAFYQAFLTEHCTWRAWCTRVPALAITPAEQEILLIYSALIWGRGQGQLCRALVASASPMVQTWVWVLLGCIRGDRQLPILRQLEPKHQQQIDQEIRQFWGQWSGLPAKNQLQLGQIPVIASCQALQTRPTPSLISQRHLNAH
jgi:hypothetical protein